MDFLGPSRRARTGDNSQSGLLGMLKRPRFIALLSCAGFVLFILGSLAATNNRRQYTYSPSSDGTFQTASPNTESPPLPLSKVVYTDSDCLKYFPDLYDQLNRNVKYWKDQGHTLSQDDVDLAWTHDDAIKILIHQNELRVLNTANAFKMDGHRIFPVLSMIQRAIDQAYAANEILPTIEVTFLVRDLSLLTKEEGDTHSAWAFTQRINSTVEKRIWLMPDWGMYADELSSLEQTVRLAKKHDIPWSKKIPQAVWTGVTYTNAAIREKLVEVTANKKWAHVQVMDWDTRENFMEKDELCKYAFTIHTEGRAYSSRLQNLLQCDSVPIVHDLEWNGHFYHLLKADGPQQNYVQVKRDWSDLEEKINWLFQHPEEAQRIVNNSLATFRNKYTTPAATSCYYRKMIQAWGKVSYTPDPYRPTNGGGVERTRGISWESFIVRHRDYNGDSED